MTLYFCQIECPQLWKKNNLTLRFYHWIRLFFVIPQLLSEQLAVLFISHHYLIRPTEGRAVAVHSRKNGSHKSKTHSYVITCGMWPTKRKLGCILFAFKKQDLAHSIFKTLDLRVHWHWQNVHILLCRPRHGPKRANLSDRWQCTSCPWPTMKAFGRACRWNTFKTHKQQNTWTLYQTHFVHNSTTC